MKSPTLWPGGDREIDSDLEAASPDNTLSKGLMVINHTVTEMHRVGVPQGMSDDALKQKLIEKETESAKHV